MGRDITKLHPVAQEKAKELVSACASKGLKITIGECLRTVAEQDKLYAKGRTASGTIVTNAKGSSYSSMHQWGIAFDIIRSDGKGSYEDSDGFFTKVGKVGQSLGLEWGGSFKSIKDKPHFQLPDWGSTATVLKKTYGTPQKFFATFASVKPAPVAPTVDNTDATPKAPITAQIGYNVHISTIGWQGEHYNGDLAGTTGRGLRIEALRVFSGDVEIIAQGHVQNVGWQDSQRGNNITIGTTGKAKRLEAIKLSLVNTSKTITYRVHVQDIGWMNWVSNGEIAGTVGQGKRIEAIEIKVI